MRRLLAILLLAVFGLPYASVLVAQEGAEAGLPACCRKNGKHHCALMQTQSSDAQGERITVVAEKCPYAPAVPAALHLSLFAAPLTASVFAELVHHPAVHEQTHAKYRISRDRSRQKRGPPSLILL
ncbi:MAG TPA: hypothetical protein VF214_08840 [Edaphobacter sp.]